MERQGNPIAEGSLNASSAAALFVIDSYHNLLPYPADEESGEYLDPYGFEESGFSISIGESIVTPTADPNNYPTGETLDYQIYLGETWWQTYGVAPQINSINASSSNSSAPLTLGSSGTLTILGVYLTADGTDQLPTVNLDPTGMGLTLLGVTVVNDGELDVGYSVSSDPGSTGTYAITVTTNAGTSPPYNVVVGDPTPAITGVTPPSWTAGTTYACSLNPIQITGSGFGTNPVLSIVSADGGTEIASYSICGGSTDGLITATVQTTTRYVPGAVYVSVTSQGYTGYGSGFVQGQGDSSGSNSELVEVAPDPLPAPTIVLGQGAGACSSGQAVPTTVVVGQLITITACIPSLPAGTQVQSESWTPSLPQGTAVSGYNITYANNVATSAQVQTVSATTCGTGSFCTYAPFYWVDQTNLRAFRFDYTLTNGSSNFATISLNVTGPSNASMTAAPSNPVIVRQGTGGPLISLGQSTPATAVGMAFSVSPLPTALQANLQGLIGPHGNYQLVQVVNSETIKERTDKGVFACVPKALSSPTPIDRNYPYPSNQGSMTTSDSPASGLNYSAMGAGYNLYELRRDFSVTMYLMFDPGIPSPSDSASCYPAYAASLTVSAASQCHGSIPVPLGSISWSYTANGINTLNPNVSQGNGTSWVVAPTCTIPGRQNGFVPGTAYPQWQTVNVNVNRSTATFNCSPQNQ